MELSEVCDVITTVCYLELSNEREKKKRKKKKKEKREENRRVQCKI